MYRSALLPAALRANSVEEFLADLSISDSDLRDLCIEVEMPTLQSLRDACPDFLRGDQPDDDGDEAVDERDRFSSAAEYIRHHFRYGDLKDSFLLEPLSSISRRVLRSSDEILEDIADDEECNDKKMEVCVCERNIWNHSSQRSMARDSWLHFSIMAKDRQFPDAIELCRNWDEFYELNILAMWQYFPASRWTRWSGNCFTEELMQLVCDISVVLFSSLRTDSFCSPGLHSLPYGPLGLRVDNVQPASIHFPQGSAASEHQWRLAIMSAHT